MIEYATFLRALAAILITNSHYNGVYPIEILASGGLLGDVLFFALSGFVLVNVKGTFVNWYQKRLIRIYPSIWIITILYSVLGFYGFEYSKFGSYFFYPTHYHFIASIVILYIPYYFIGRSRYLIDKVPMIMFGTFVVQLLIYIFFYDKTYYHIDAVKEPMIRFLFFQSMLMGLYFRVNHIKYLNNKKFANWILLLVSLTVYFGTKIAFIKVEQISQLQIINQVILFVTLYFIFRCFASIDDELARLSDTVKKPIAFIARITLQIYAVQYVIIPRLAHIVFPFNWLIITFAIITTAYILFIIGDKASFHLQKFINKIFRIKLKEVT